MKTKPQQTDIVSEARKLSTSIEAVNWLHYPPLTKLVSPVPELLRQLCDEVERGNRDHRLTIDTFRQQERIWNQKFDEQENENTALREQLAHVLVCSGTPDDCESCKEAARSVHG